MNKTLARGLVAVVSLAVAGAARAVEGDVDVSAITGAGAQIALVGAAVFAIYVGIKLFKWIRKAL